MAWLLHMGVFQPGGVNILVWVRFRSVSFSCVWGGCWLVGLCQLFLMRCRHDIRRPCLDELVYFVGVGDVIEVVGVVTAATLLVA